MKEWVLRDEILAATHRWPVIVIFVLVGGLFGWVSSLWVLSPYRATTELSVELNPYRTVEDRYVGAYANVEFRNPDDYKHWQMTQLGVLVTSDDYLQETLNRLRTQDPGWDSVDVSGLRAMLEANWRNAGRWKLIAEGRQAQQVAQAVEIWRDVIIDKASSAVAHSKELYQLDLDMRANATQLNDAKLRLSELPQIKEAISTWKVGISASSDREQLDVQDRWRLFSLTARAAGQDASWRQLLDDFPAPEAPTSMYTPWVDQLLVAIDQEIERQKARFEIFNQERVALESEWDKTLQEGHGLAATLVIEKPSNASPEVKRTHPTGLAVLIGGMVGLLVWGIVVLVQITRRGYR